jgi:molybdopterin synthase catalytic subunit/molybdopterin converting factor small subunit
MLREVAGRERDSVELPEGARVSDVLERYEKKYPALGPYYATMAVAVNQEYSHPQASLKEGDVVALIPPVSGGLDPERSGGTDSSSKGSMPGRGAGDSGEGKKAGRAPLVREPIESAKIVAEIRRPEDGAVAVFEGIVRNHSRNRRTLYLEYEAYEAMALRQLEQLAEGALAQFAIREVAVVHRLGRLEIGETSVLIVVASAHRGAAFDACRWLIDTLKKTVPIWKKEYFEDGAVWADGEGFPEDVAKGK